MKPTLSVIIPALNEEANIAATVEAVTKTLSGGHFVDYELLLFNDGSRDRTGEIMDRLAAENSRVRVTHNAQSRNMGGAYKQGIALAQFDYLIMVPGDNEIPGQSVAAVLNAVGQADIIAAYTTNAHTRPLGRRIGSYGYTKLINLLFGYRLKYYNGIALIRTTDLRTIGIRTNSFAFQSEILIKLIRAGRSYHEVGIEIQPQPDHTSKALSLRNLITVLQAVVQLVVEIYFQRPATVKQPVLK